MGHGDELVIADGNFPAASIAAAPRAQRWEHGPELLEAILKFFPLDPYVDNPVALMQVVPGDTYKPTIWETYKKIVKNQNNKNKSIENIERFAFYERAKKSLCRGRDERNRAVRQHHPQKRRGQRVRFFRDLRKDGT